MCVDLLETFLVRLMACNAADGTACAMAGTVDMRAAFTTACDEFQRGYPQGPDEEFERLFRRACLGDPDLPLAPARPAAAPFAALCHDPLEVDELSTVVTLATLLRLMSVRDKTRLERDHSVRFTAIGSSSGTTGKDVLESMLVSRLENLPAAARTFRIAPNEAHGRPYLWFTAREDLEGVFADRVTLGQSRANIARDYLGLVHHGPVARGSGGMNHLVALHFPARIAAEAGYLRPSAVQAFDNRRFIVRFGARDARPHTDWGRALDLHLFASATDPPMGGRERIFLRLQDSLLLSGETIRFEYLSAVSDLRGLGARDDDDAFLDLVREDRDVDDLVAEMCG